MLGGDIAVVGYDVLWRDDDYVSARVPDLDTSAGVGSEDYRLKASCGGADGEGVPWLGRVIRRGRAG